MLAALVPLVHRIAKGKRAAVGSSVVKAHVGIGAAAALFAFLHTVSVLPVLGSPAAIAGGMLAIAPAGIAFFVVVAHVGIGLRLRRPQLRDRVKLRRTHAFTAVTIVVTATVHVVMLLRAGSP